MKPNENKEAQRWLAQAERDLDDARYVTHGGRYNLACFICQQTVEKVLKAYLFSRGAKAVWGHSVAELCEDASALDGDFTGLGNEVGYLDRFYIPTRYPNGLPGGIPSDAFLAEDARKALAAAERAVEFVRRKVSP